MLWESLAGGGFWLVLEGKLGDGNDLRPQETALGQRRRRRRRKTL
jgi:hypothetical protein